MKKESVFQKELMNKIAKRWPNAIVLKNDSSYVQGFPDLTILFEDKWVALETKRTSSAHRQPNQEYYVNLLNKMSYASFICPENVDGILNEIAKVFSEEKR